MCEVNPHAPIDNRIHRSQFTIERVLTMYDPCQTQPGSPLYHTTPTELVVGEVLGDEKAVWYAVEEIAPNRPGTPAGSISARVRFKDGGDGWRTWDFESNADLPVLAVVAGSPADEKGAA